MRILLISQSFMAPHLGEGENNYGGTEAFCNNFCLAYHKKHEITVYAMADATCTIQDVILKKCGNYSRAYLEQQSGKKERCNNGGLVNLINTDNLAQYDLIIDNTCNKTVYEALERNLNKLEGYKPKAYSIAHSRPSYAGMGVNDNVINMSKIKNVNFISVTDSSTNEWNKLAVKLGLSPFFKGSFGLRVLDKLKSAPFEFNYNNPAGLLVARIDPVKNFGQYQAIADNTPNMEFHSFALLIPCGMKEYDNLKTDRHKVIYHLNQDVEDKEVWIRTCRPMTFSTSVSENGGTTCLESMMYGLPICVVAHRENGCAKYVQDGEEIYINDDFLITTHGILMTQNGHAHENFKQALAYAIENKVFDSDKIRKYFVENYSFNDAAIENLLSL